MAVYLPDLESGDGFLRRLGMLRYNYGSGHSGHAVNLVRAHLQAFL